MRILLLGMAFFHFSAFSEFDIQCNGFDCFTNGWVVSNLRTGDTSEVTCLKGSCEQFGWTQLRNGKVLSSIECQPGGCFLEGWRVISSETGRPQMEVRCLASEGSSNDCLKFGWVVHTVRNQRLVSETHCVDKNCSMFGWRTETAQGKIQISQCKEKACFQSGWTLRP